MEASSGVETFLREPAGHYLVGRHFFIWCHSLDFTGSIMWGRPEERDTQELVGIWRELHPRMHNFDVVTDGSRIESIDAAGVDDRDFELGAVDELGRVHQELGLAREGHVIDGGCQARAAPAQLERGGAGERILVEDGRAAQRERERRRRLAAGGGEDESAGERAGHRRHTSTTDRGRY